MEYPFVGKKRGLIWGWFIYIIINHSASWRNIERILERYKVYLGVKDVKLVVRPYKTRSAFTKLTSSPPTIYINEYLIDDEEIIEIFNNSGVDAHKAPHVSFEVHRRLVLCREV